MFRLIKQPQSNSSKDSQKNNNNQDNLSSDNSKNDEYTYASMRKLAFSFTHEDMGVKLGNDYQVFGAVVDMGISSSDTATMICFIDGTTSLYFSNGGGIIGAGQHEAVKNAVLKFLEECYQTLPVTKQAESIDILPEENHHTFYLFTKAGVFSVNIDINDVQKNKEYQLLFYESQMVLNEIKKVGKKNN